jgi:uncharacterized protein (DUF1697 family)
MNSWIALLRGVNVTGHNQISMETLRELCVSIKVRSPQTYIQSGNVVFASPETDHAKLAARLGSAIEKRCGFRPSVMLRTAAEMRDVEARNPFAGRANIEPARLAVFFLSEPLADEIARKVRAINVGSEEIHAAGRELYIYFPDGMGKSKLQPVLQRTLKLPATARNWNTVNKLLAMAAELDAAL